MGLLLDDTYVLLGLDSRLVLDLVNGTSYREELVNGMV